ncbi:hypothetical protein YPPY36_2523, partial [Yersinia pestis PY-36]|jgi:hypothetical protein
MQP